MAGAAGPHRPGRGRRLSRPAGVVRGDRGRGRSPSGWRRTPGRRASSPKQALWFPALAGADGRGRLHGPPQHRARARGPPGRLPGRALLLARGPVLSWALGAHHVADWSAQIGPRRPRGGPGRCSRRPSCGSSTSRSSPTRGACAPGRSCRGRASSAAGSATRWSAGTRSSASPGPCSCSPSCRLPHVLPALLGQPRPDLMGGYLDPLARRRAPPRLDAGPGERGRSSSPWGRCCCSSSPGCSCGATPWRAAAVVVLLLAPRRPRRAARRRGSRCPCRRSGTVSWILLLLRFGLLAAIVGLFAHDLLDQPAAHRRPVVVDGRARRSSPCRSWPSSRCWPRAAPWAGPGCAAASRARRPRGPEPRADHPSGGGFANLEAGRTPRGWSGRRAPRDRPPRGAATRSPRPRAAPRPSPRRRARPVK